MATQTWSWSTSSAASSNAGTSWLSYTLSGSALPSNAVITNVEYGLIGRIGSYESDDSYIFRLYSIAVENGPYTNASYSASASSNYSSFSAATTTGTSNTTTRPSSNYTTQSFENGLAYVWRYSSNRTYCELENCDFVNQTSTSAFFNNTINLRIKFNSNLSGTTYIMAASVTVTYETASVTAPSNLALYQLTSGQYFLTWDQSTGSNGSGDVTYTVWSVSDGEPIASVGTSTYYLANIPGYDHYYEYRVIASYSGVTANSSIVGSYFQPPSITAPVFSLTPETGDSTVLSWTKPTINYGTATYCDYTIRYSTSYSSDIEYYTLTDRDDSNISLAVSSSWLDSVVSDGETIFFTLTTTAYVNSYVADSFYETLTTTTEAIMFTYDGKNTIAYYNGSNWELCAVHYYTGSEWKECIPYYYDGTTWQEIKTKL